MEEKLLLLLDGCLNNNRNSQKLLYQEYYNFAMNICLRYTSNRYEASEVLNDGFFKAFVHLGKFDQNKPFKAWLAKIMHHTSIDYYRANHKGAFMEDITQAGDIESEITIEHQLDYEDLLAIVQSLPPAYRVVFNLYEIDGYSHDEIAKMLKISTGTSRSNLFKAKQKLQEMVSVKRHLKSKNNHTDLKTDPIQQPVKKLFIHKNPGKDEK